VKIISNRAQRTGHPEAVRWNKRYRAGSASWLGHPTKRLLLDFAHFLPAKGLALDVASGVATNSIFLAERGLAPVALDISYVAAHIARERFIENGIPLNLVVCDLKRMWLPTNHFEVIINFCYLERSIFPLILNSLKYGGLLIFESYLKGSNHLSNPDHYLKRGELHDAFSELDVIHNKQIVREDGTKKSGRKVEQLVAIKPIPTGPY